MKKIIIILSIIISILVLNKSKVPEESIRFRILANSNSEIDQKTKREIIKVISNELQHRSNNIEEERKYIKEQIPNINKKIKETTNESYIIEYGDNYFPEKQYKDETFAEGKYESLVITLGEGKGDNFWCILFPPLCMIDDDENIEYESIIKEVWNKYYEHKIS